MTSHDQQPADDLDVLVVGAGFAGLYALHRLRELGLRVRVLERGDGVGGTWFYNRYPGARCDIESIDYCYSFSEELLDEWQWSERYSAQPEILDYLDYVADRFDLRRDIQLCTEVSAATFDEDSNRWLITTSAGEAFSAPWCVMATGCLSSIKRPQFPGLESFNGRWFHTARWPQGGVDFSGQRVGVIGTGSTAIQAIPQIARQAERLFVFQRTANYSMPAHNGPLDPQVASEIRRNFSERRLAAQQSDAGVPFPWPETSAFEVSDEERRRLYEAGWQRGGINALSYAFTDYFSNPDANATAAEFTREKIRSIVQDPDVAEALCPRQHIGTKRTCVDTGYYETYNRDNVELVDVRRSPIEAITADGLRTTDREYTLDAIVFAIGFDAITGALLDIDITGPGGRTLREHWALGPRAYLGLASAGFPNLFMVTGPGSPSVLSNMVVSIEQHVDWIADCIVDLRRRGVQRIEATADAEVAWVQHVNELADATLYPVANSWYVGANIPGKPRVFMPYVGGCGPYRRACDEVAAQGYRGFVLGSSPTEQLEPSAAGV